MGYALVRLSLKHLLHAVLLIAVVCLRYTWTPLCQGYWQTALWCLPPDSAKYTIV